MDTLTGDFIISKFMGYTYPSLLDYSFEVSVGDLHNYHEDWNLLMSVVEKIEAIGTYQVEIELFSCYVINSNKITEKESSIIIQSHEDSKIKAVWGACVQFIQWYTTQSHPPQPGK